MPVYEAKSMNKFNGKGDTAKILGAETPDSF